MSELLPTESRFSSIYPTPFFKVGDTYMPPTVRELFRWCRYFFLTDGTIQTVISKMSQYPITRLLYECNESQEKVYKKILEDRIDIFTEMISIGIDYFTYGNCYVGFREPTIRMAKCKVCNKDTELTNYKKVKVKFQKYRDPKEGDGKYNLRWDGMCPHCKRSNLISVRDVKSEGSHDFRLIRWDPLAVEIDHNPVTKDSKYVYEVPPKISSEITQMNQESLQKTPLSFIEAVMSSESAQRVIMGPPQFFHFKRPSLTHDDKNAGYGMPLILPALKLIYYMNILRRHQEAIAHEHITPLRILHPGNMAGGVNPYQHGDIPAWGRRLEEQVKRWRTDPNEFLITSIPVGVENVGGDAKGLFVTPELQFVRREIIASMDVPIEFVDGGLQWSGSSVSLRMLENQFMSYRTRLQRFVNWIVKMIAQTLQIEPITIKFSDFKTADDLSRRQQLMNMNQLKKISDKTVIEEMGVDYENEKKLVEKEIMEGVEFQSKIAKTQAKHQAEITMAQQMANFELQKLMEAAMEPTQEQVEKVIYLLASLEPETQRDILEQLETKNKALYGQVFQNVFPQPVQTGPGADVNPPSPGPGNSTQVQAGKTEGNKQLGKAMQTLPSSKPPRRKSGQI